MKNFLGNFIVGLGMIVFLTHTAKAQWVQIYGPGVSAFAADGSNIIMETNGYAFLSTNNGTNWTSVNNGLKGVVHSFVLHGSYIIAGTDKNGIFLSTDTCKSWITPDSVLISLPFIPTFSSFSVIGNNIFAGTLQSGVLLSADTGKNWTAVNSGFPAAGNVSSLAVMGSNIFAGTYSSGVFHTSNNGIHWTAANNGITNKTVSSLAVMGSNIFAGTAGGIFRSFDSGVSWTAANNGLPACTSYVVIGGKDSTFSMPEIQSLAVTGTIIFAGDGCGGVFQSFDSGASWDAIGSNLKNGSNFLALNGTYLFAGTNIDGVWRRPLSEMIGVIYQKPDMRVFNQSNLKICSSSSAIKTFEFNLAQSDYVRVKVFNLSGHEIATLVNKQFGTGSHSLSWNTQNIAPGFYFIKMQTSVGIQLKQFPVIK